MPLQFNYPVTPSLTVITACTPAITVQVFLWNLYPSDSRLRLNRAPRVTPNSAGMTSRWLLVQHIACANHVMLKFYTFSKSRLLVFSKGMGEGEVYSSFCSMHQQGAEVGQKFIAIGIKWAQSLLCLIVWAYKFTNQTTSLLLTHM